MTRRRLVCSSVLVCAVLALASPASAQSSREISFERDRALIMLKTVSDEVRDHYYDPTLNGLNWQALTDQAREKIKNAKSVGEMYTAIFSLIDKLQDSHTSFWPPSFATRIRFGFKAKQFGDEIRIFEVKERSAAAAAGLQPGDRILRVNGFTAQRATWDKMMLFFRVLRPVTAFDLVIQRGEEPPRPLRLEAKVQQQAAVLDFTKSAFDYYRLIDEAEEDREDFIFAHHDGGVVYLKITTFSADDHMYKVAAKELENARAAIIDLRNNGGGAVENLSYFTGFFEPEPTALAEVAYRNKSEPVKVKPHSPNFKGPMFVLVDSHSASASEMFARYFQRSRRAVIIGDHTQGLVNASQYFSENVGSLERQVLYGVQIAVGRVRFADGEELEKKGVAPDQRCLPTGADLQQGSDVCRTLAVGMARKALGLPERAPAKAAEAK